MSGAMSSGFASNGPTVSGTVSPSMEAGTIALRLNRRTSSLATSAGFRLSNDRNVGWEFKRKYRITITGMATMTRRISAYHLNRPAIASPRQAQSS
jgi:hypothetical protein